MPKPEFAADDYVNPKAPEDERRLRPDHPRVRDHSHDCARSTQELELWKGSFIATVMEPWDAYPDLGEIPDAGTWARVSCVGVTSTGPVRP